MAQAGRVITLNAPAKINLTLEVLGKRPDGYHEVRSIMQAISLHDVLQFDRSDGLRFDSDLPQWDGEKSLVSRASRLLQQAAGVLKGASLSVKKRIPLQSGLGGDSSDAAAALAGLDRLWDLNTPATTLAGLGAKLGSDVPFFFHGGTALAAGRGETVTPLPAIAPQWVLVVVPRVPLLEHKTKAMYQSLTRNQYTDGSITEHMAGDIRTGRSLDHSLLFNTFESVAFVAHPGLETAWRHIQKMGAPNLHLTGSGPALFSVFHNRAEAEDLGRQLTEQHLECHLAETAGPHLF
jgi:4-diphosphocytidyl-2-C-methyl-D-erythritol kinase